MNTDPQNLSPVLITGASSGLGLALARQLANMQHGHIVITGRNTEKLARACAQLATPGSAPASGIRLDQSSRDSIDQCLAELAASHLLPRLLIANIGVNIAHTSGFHKIHRTEFSDIETSLTTNVINTLYLVMQCIPPMQKSGGGKIVLIGSQAYQYGLVGQVAYNMSKSALLGLHNSINREYRNISSYLFELGIIDNERNARFMEQLVKNPLLKPLDEQDAAASILTDVMHSSRGLKRNIP